MKMPSAANPVTASFHLVYANCEQKAKSLRSLLAGKTFMNLIVEISGDQGNWGVYVSTTREETSEVELKDMVLSVLAMEAV